MVHSATRQARECATVRCQIRLQYVRAVTCFYGAALIFKRLWWNVHFPALLHPNKENLMKKRFISALLALSLAACSAPQSLQATDSSAASSPTDLIAGNPSAVEEVNAVDHTPASIDQHLQASAVAWTGTKFAFNDPKEVEYGKGVTSDPSSNVIAVGSSYGFNGSLSYYPDLSLLVHQQNLVITKFNAAGAITWKRMIGSSAQGAFKTSGFNLQDVPAGVVTDPSGNIYVSGTVGGVWVDGSNSGNQNAFLIKFNSSGSIVWSRVLGGAGDDGVTGMAINGTNIYLTGYACGNGLNFAGNTIRGACDVFVTKYDSGGNRLWAKLFGSSGNDFSAKIAKVSSGGAVVVGTNQGALDANGNPQNKNGFVVRLDPNGNTIWNRTIATPQNDDALAVTASSDAVYIGGNTLGNLNGVARIRSSTFVGDGFVMKASLSVGATQWTRYVGSNEIFANTAYASVTDLALNSGQLFVFGTGFNSIIEDTDVAWPVRYDAAGNRTADAVVNGYATPDARGSNAKVAMGLGANGVFLVLDDYLTKTPASPQPNFTVYVAKLGFDLKQK
jgi:hypothetical protein